MPAVSKESSICITGAGGYVGSWIVKMLLEKGYRVRACVRDASSDRNDFLRLMPAYSAGQLTLHSCDISTPCSLDSILSGCHGLVHAAADPDLPLERRPEEYSRSSQYIVDSVRKTESVVRVIYVSSAAAVMGDSDLNELRLQSTIDEERYPNRNNPHGVNGYVEGKLHSEKLFSDAANASGGRWDAVITNPGDNVGPILSSSHAMARKAFTPWHCIIAQMISEGIISQSFAFRPWWIVDVRDTADVHVRFLESTTLGMSDSSERYFVCSTETIDVENIGDAIATSMPHVDFDLSDWTMSDSEFNRQLLLQLGMTESEAREIWKNCKLHNHKVCRCLGFSFRPLEETLRDCVESLISVAGVRPRLKERAKRKVGALLTSCEQSERCICPRLEAPALRAATPEEIPVIDLSTLLSERTDSISVVAAQIRKACLGTGFFYVSGHGLEHHLTSLLEQMRGFFKTSDVDKAKSSIDKYQRGFRGRGHDQEPGRLPDCKESFDVGVDLPLTHPAVEAAVAMHGPNQWPSHFPELRQPAENYFVACESLGRKLLKAIAYSLEEPLDFFEPHCSEAMVQMRMFHYFPPEDKLGLYGSSPHTDYGMITLLAQDPIGGLEVQMLNGEWVRAPYIEGTLVVNIGDMLSRWTNDVYHSTLHRVINRANRDRYSVAMFYHLNADSWVSPVESCCEENTPPKYKPIKYLSHIVSRFEEVLKAKF